MLGWVEVFECHCVTEGFRAPMKCSSSAGTTLSVCTFRNRNIELLSLANMVVADELARGRRHEHMCVFESRVHDPLALVRRS